jgi:uncharacterized protein YbjT (DUF2867 family)
MKIILTGATGLVGEGVLLTILNDKRVEAVLSVSRKTSGIEHPKMKELLVADFMQIHELKDEFIGYDALFYCAGISSLGMTEEAYTKVTYDTPMAVAKALLSVNPNMVINHISGGETDSTEKGKVMWARVKGKIENALMAMPFKAVYNLRPGFMKPAAGQQNVHSYYKAIRFAYPFLKLCFPSYGCELKELGTAMVNLVEHGYDKKVLEVKDIIKASRKA